MYVVPEDVSHGANNHLGESLKLLFKWHGSIYAHIWRPVLVYFVAYISLTLLYDYGLDEFGKKGFEAVASYFSRYTGSIPVILLLGFFTSTAMTRWFSIMAAMPGTGRPITVFTLSLKENLPEGPRLIQQYSRWLLLSWVLTFRMVCKPLRETYPNLESLQNAGLLQEHERVLLEEEESKSSQCTNLPLLVLDWIIHLLKTVNRQGQFANTADINRNMETLMTFKKSCGNIIKFSSKNIPFALIQAVAVTVYSVGLTSLMSRQFPMTPIASYFPILHIIQYFIYFAWFKFGRAAANPFGDDEDDIDVKKLFKLHIKDALRIANLYTNDMDNLIAKSLESSLSKWPSQIIDPEADESEISSTTFK